METIMRMINENWIWLGPVMCLVSGWVLIALVWGLLRDATQEIEDATREWKAARDKGAEIKRQIENAGRINS